MGHDVDGARSHALAYVTELVEGGREFVENTKD